MNIRLPHINGRSNEERISQIVAYLRELAQILERKLVVPVQEQQASPESEDTQGVRIISRGTKGDWHWRKYSDGTAECWCGVAQGVECTNAWGDLYYGYCENVGFPFSFATAPLCNITVEAKADTGNYVWLASHTKTTKSKPGAVVAVSNKPHLAEIVVVYHTIGRWK